VEFDHYPEPAHAENSATLENCMAVCPICHRVKSNTWDIPAEAKIKRRKRANGPIEDRRKTQRIPKPANHKWPKRAFQSRKTK
jgi:5-methylcytosine-specific restriction endonuclease McrA